MKTLKTGIKLLIAVLFSVGLVGCLPDEEMTRKEVIDAVKQCEDAGMEARLYVNWNSEIKKINCLPIRKTAD